MRYVEVPIEEAIKRCKKNTKVLVAEQDLENEDCDIIFVVKKRKEYDELFKDIQTAASLSDDFMEQLRLFTEHQDIPNIRPHGIQKIVLIKEWVLIIGQKMSIIKITIDLYEQMFYTCSYKELVTKKKRD